MLFGTAGRPVDALIFPPLPAPGDPSDLLTAIDFMVSGPFSTASGTARQAARKAAHSPSHRYLRGG